MRRLLSERAFWRLLYLFCIGIHWDVESRLFPKTTLCDFSIREYGHPKLAHEYTVPCVLLLNLFNEQMFTFLYFWYALVIVLNIADFLLWLSAITPRNRRTFIHKRLHSKGYNLRHQLEDRANIAAFTNDYLEADGFFIVTLIKENTSDYVAAEIIHRLYREKFLPKYLHESRHLYDRIESRANPRLAEMEEEEEKKRHHLCSMIC